MLKDHWREILRKGTVIGVIGAGLVGGWFLVVDLILGRPFFTPAVLGSAVFFGLRDPATVEIGFQSVMAYTVLHVVAFILVGMFVATVVVEARGRPSVLWLFAEFFIIFEFGFLAAVGIAFRPLLAELAWFNVVIGNLIAAAGMGYYLWRMHSGGDSRI